MGQAFGPMWLVHESKVRSGDRAVTAVVHMACERLQPKLPEIVVEEPVEFVVKGPRLGPEVGKDAFGHPAVDQVGRVARKGPDVGVEGVRTERCLAHR